MTDAKAQKEGNTVALTFQRIDDEELQELVASLKLRDGTLSDEEFTLYHIGCDLIARRAEVASANKRADTYVQIALDRATDLCRRDAEIAALKELLTSTLDRLDILADDDKSRAHLAVTAELMLSRVRIRAALTGAAQCLYDCDDGTVYTNGVNPQPCPHCQPVAVQGLRAEQSLAEYRAAFSDNNTELGKALIELDELREQLAAAEADARRYRHSQTHGFPVRNQTGDPDRRWIAFVSRWMMSKEFYGATPSFAIDAAIAAIDAASLPAPPTGKQP